MSAAWSAFGAHHILVFFGTDYADVERGTGPAKITEFGNLRLTGNFENAPQTLGISLGDEIQVSR